MQENIEKDFKILTLFSVIYSLGVASDNTKLLIMFIVAGKGKGVF